MTTANNGMGKSCKMHGTHQEAFNCYAAWLLRQGYKRIGTREFMAPNDGPITVLTKAGRFGARMRQGKAGEKMAKSDRFQPEARGHLCVAGTIVG